MAKYTFLSIVTVLFLIYFNISLGSTKLLDYRLQQNLTRAKCTTPGPFCTNCKIVSMCVADPINGGYEDMYVRRCSVDETCLNGLCTKASNPQCSVVGNLAFRCVTSGMFPNPGDCKKYHYCVPRAGGLEEVKVDCTNNYGYNPKTTYCDKKLPNDLCNGYPLPICTTAGEEAPLKENPTIFYTCLEYEGVLYPIQQACDNGKIFSTANRCK